MQPIEAIIAGYLAAYPALRAIHGGQACQGIADQDWKAPYQTVFVISDPSGQRRLGILSSRLQITNVANQYGQAKRMAELTRQALDGLAGTLEGITIKQGIYQDLNVNYEDDTGKYIAPVDMIIVYRG